MKKILENDNLEKIYKAQKKLNDNCFECKIKESSNKYELYVDENIYDDALILLDIEKVDHKRNDKKINPYKKGTFLYIVEQYFLVKYYKLILVSVFYSILPEFFLFYHLFQKIKENGIDVLILESLILTFLLNLIISQIIILSTRYYQFISEVKDVFRIRINGKKDYSKYSYKIVNFIMRILLHLAYMVFIVISFL